MIEALFEEECCAVAGAADTGAPAPLPESRPPAPPRHPAAQPRPAEQPTAPRPRRVLVVEFM